MEPALSVALIQAIALLAAYWLSARRHLLDRGLHYLVSVAIGVLLATALLHILPESVSALGNRQVLWVCFAGTLGALYCVQRLVAGNSAHSHGERADTNPSLRHQAGPTTILLAGTLHSLVDGVSVAAAFAAGHRVGWLTAGAIALHEVPHRMGAFALLTHLRVSRTHAFRLLVTVSLAALVGVGLVLVAGHTFHAVQWLLPMSAGSFVYIALVNLMPELAETVSLQQTCGQLLCMLLGAVGATLLLRLPAA